MLNQYSQFSPSLIFLEVTNACEYQCLHCRAESQKTPSPDDLTTQELKNTIDQIITLWGKEAEIIFTGGNPLIREDLKELIEYVAGRGLRFGISPAASDALTPEFLSFLRERGCSMISLSLDGGNPSTHDWLRNRKGSFADTLSLINAVRSFGLNVQINTTVFMRNVHELPTIAKIAVDYGVEAWEIFFLINTGRGSGVENISSEDYMDINHWLRTVRDKGLNVRTVEGPIFRVMNGISKDRPDIVNGATFNDLMNNSESLMDRIKPNDKEADQGSFGGTLFVSHNGDVFPSGLFKLNIGNLRSNFLAEIVINSMKYLGKNLKNGLKGKCGSCKYKYACGGSRARAMINSGDPMQSDPLCLYS